MKLYTIQSYEVWDEAIKKGLFRGDKDKVWESWGPNNDHCLKAYEWMYRQLKTGIKNFSGDWPIWAWPEDYDKNRVDYYLRQEPQIRLNFEVPDDRCLVSDHEDWHFALNDWFMPENDDDDVEHDKTRKEREQSWERIFSTKKAHHTFQVCVDRIYISEITSVEAVGILCPETIRRILEWGMEDVLQEKIREAMKSGNTAARDIYKVALAEIQRATGAKELPEDRQQAIVRKLINSNRETISQAKEGKADAEPRLSEKLGKVVAQLETENAILKELLPETWTEEQIRQLLSEKNIDVTQAKNDGHAMGIAMKALKQEPGAVVEASTVKKVVDAARSK